jgi:hypothetical protein
MMMENSPAKPVPKKVKIENHFGEYAFEILSSVFTTATTDKNKEGLMFLRKEI